MSVGKLTPALLPSLRAYCHWAESVRVFDDMRRDDSVLPEIQEDSRISRNALLEIRRAMGSLFESVCADLFSFDTVHDTGSGVNPDSGKCFISGEFFTGDTLVPFLITDDGVATFDL